MWFRRGDGGGRGFGFGWFSRVEWSGVEWNGMESGGGFVGWLVSISCRVEREMEG